MLQAGKNNELKPLLRSLFGTLSTAINETPSFDFPPGMEAISFPGCKGFRVESGKFLVRPHVWNDDKGLQDQVLTREKSSERVVAAVNGAFFT